MSRIPFLLVLLLLGGNRVGCRKEEDVVLVSIYHLQWGTDQTITLQPNSRFSSLQKSGISTKSSTMLELKPSIPSTSVNTQNLHHFLRKLVISDEARVSSLQSRIRNPLPNKHQLHQLQSQIPLTSGATLQTLNYIINIKIGSNPTTVIVDTGSDLTWVQCKPCSYCYSQQNPIYDPSTSPTYHQIPCNSTTCTFFLSSTCSTANLQNTCNYGLRYGDGSYTIGVLAQETISLGDTNIEGFVFGCGRTNKGLFGGTSGLVGLGRTQISLVSQTKPQFGGVFSYCLPARVFNSTGNLVLGGGDDSNIYKNTTPIAYTRMIQGPRQAPFYFLNLTGIRVGGVELSFTKGNRVLIDSGTVITRVVPSIYGVLKNEFVRQFSQYPRAPSFSILDTCFDLSKYEEVRVPKLGFGFEGGVDVGVDVSGVLYFVKKDASQVCLAATSLVDEDGVGIIGNYQQKNQRVVYDNVGSRVGFAVETCS